MHTVKSFWNTTVLTTVKDLKIAMAYKQNFAGTIVQLAMRILFFILMASVVKIDGNVSLEGRNLFVFFASAILIWFFSNDSLYGSLNTLGSDLYNGTLEYMFYLPVQRHAYFMGTVMARIAVNMVYFVPTLIFLAIYNSIPFINCLYIILVCLLVCFSLINLGIWMASLGLVWKQVGSIVGIITLLFDFLAGAFIPVSEYPGILQYSAYILPQTWGYDLIRYYAIGEAWQPLQPVLFQFGAITVLSLFFMLMSVMSMRKAEKLCLKSGFNII